MDKLKLAQLGERLKTGGAQMGRIVSGKMKEILQTPTPESKMVDDATLETLNEPNWSMNLRICGMINSEEFNGSEIVKAIKRRINHKSPVTQRLTFDLLETIAMNCEKVFSEVASEKVLDDMVRLVQNPEGDGNNRKRAFQLIRAWGESQDLAYLPVFRQTYMSLKEREEPLDFGGDNSPTAPYTLESYLDQQRLNPPGIYPTPPSGSLHALNDSSFSSDQHISIEEKKEHLVIARNSLELLSSILNTEEEPKPLKEELTLNLLDKCKQSLSIIKGIVESTTNDEVTLFEALYLNDELQQLVSKYEELEAAKESGEQQPQNADTAKDDAETIQNPNKQPEKSESEESENLERELPEKFNTLEVNLNVEDHHVETKIEDSRKENGAGSSSKINNE
ncbi:hypothetical protein Lal_00018030 [Lupinus albus]|uniref:Putative GAT domain-containing protein n=1 Tax=Lupinus albus TaxID=3870 RepID=A0A6A5LYT1_LUPAL|nr:putative GAT domain-containing protein [Lupinus albus]KAF1866646.1 hypothetical protein Lal_00018030 [Lupinus albus]